MKNLALKLCLLVGAACLLRTGNLTSALAAEENPAGTDQRLQRLERRINELSERQEQLLRRLAAAQEPQERMMRRPGVPSEQPGPMPFPGAEAQHHPLPPMGKPGPVAEGLGHVLHLLLLVGLICNILLAIWIFTDIRKRGEGSGIFIALALVAGIPTAIIYAIVRIGDRAAATAK